MALPVVQPTRLAEGGFVHRAARYGGEPQRRTGEEDILRHISRHRYRRTGTSRPRPPTRGSPPAYCRVHPAGGRLPRRAARATAPAHTDRHPCRSEHRFECRAGPWPREPSAYPTQDGSRRWPPTAGRTCPATKAPGRHTPSRSDGRPTPASTNRPCQGRGSFNFTGSRANAPTAAITATAVMTNLFISVTFKIQQSLFRKIRNPASIRKPTTAKSTLKVRLPQKNRKKTATSCNTDSPCDVIYTESGPARRKDRTEHGPEKSGNGLSEKTPFARKSAPETKRSATKRPKRYPVLKFFVIFADYTICFEIKNYTHEKTM